MIDTVAVVGATGAVGRIIVELLLARQFPARKIKLLASPRSAGQLMEVAGSQFDVEVLRPESFEGVDIAIGSTPDEVAAEFVPWAVERGTVVVDESAFYRMHPDVPLVIPEVNFQAIDTHKGVIASPNCSTTQMVMVLKPLHDAALGDDTIGVCATCIRVPVANSHSESILIETERKLTAAEARRLLALAPGIVVEDDLATARYPLPRACSGRDEVFVGRIREDGSSPNGIALWCVSDNLRKGAATNAVQIAEYLAKHGVRVKQTRVGGFQTVWV